LQGKGGKGEQKKKKRKPEKRKKSFEGDSRGKETPRIPEKPNWDMGNKKELEGGEHDQTQHKTGGNVVLQAWTGKLERPPGGQKTSHASAWELNTRARTRTQAARYKSMSPVYMKCRCKSKNESSL